MAADQEQAKQAVAALKRLDVVLVIDATVSMREEILASLIAVMELAEKLASDDISVQFAFVFYRDEPDFHRNPQDYALPQTGSSSRISFRFLPRQHFPPRT